jgi:site-specific DNA recombinase
LKRILTISPKTQAETKNAPQQAKLKVCAYCRVSSASNEQMASYEAQVEYYKKYIQQNPAWEFVGIYADSGVSGTRTTGRTQFNRMIKDAEGDKIELIVTKSISRFVRNTLDCLEVVRFLKTLGVAVYFERENINTLSAESELLLSVLSSIAQEESRGISDNIRWAYRKKFLQGKVTVATSRLLGYDTDDKGQLMINQREAEVVKRIFCEYIAGKGIRTIIMGLEADNIRTVTGLAHWPESTIRNILTNEKYCGDAVLQKTYVADYLTHKKKKNRGELPMYRVSGNHRPIISKEDFDLAQRLMSQRAAEYGNLPGDRSKYARHYAFSGKLVCGRCGASFKRRTWNSKEPSKQIVWQCSTYIKKGKAACSIKAVDDITLKAVFMRVFNKLYINKESVLKQFMVNIEKTLCSGRNHEQVNNVESETDKITGQIKELIRKQIKGIVEPSEFQAEYRKLKARLEILRNQKSGFVQDEGKLEEVKARTRKIAAFLEEQASVLTEFDEDIFCALVERVKVLSPTHLVFELKNGLAVEQKFIKRKGIRGLQ